MSKKIAEISFLNIVSLIAVAGLIDMLQIISKIFYVIPLVGAIPAMLFGLMLSVIAIVLFSIWLPIIGISIFDRMPIMLATIMVEAIPFPLINALPGWSTFILATIFVINKKAKYNKANNEVS